MTDETKALNESMRELATLQRQQLKSQGWFASFSHGVWAGIGGTVGVALVLTLLTAFLQHAAVIPVVGHWLSELTPLPFTAK